MFKFDIKQGYHHIEICPEQWCYLGFSWIIEGVLRYFMYVVLAFGITSAPFIFTKVMRELVRYWRRNSIKIACFIDDGAGHERNYEKARKKANFVKKTPYTYPVSLRTKKNQYGNLSP